MKPWKYRVTIDADDDAEILFRGQSVGAYFDVVTDHPVRLLDEVSVVERWGGDKAEELRRYIREAKRELQKGDDYQAGGNRTVTVTCLELSIPEYLYHE